jgi:hypothetical protein
MRQRSTKSTRAGLADHDSLVYRLLRLHFTTSPATRERGKLKMRNSGSPNYPRVPERAAQRTTRPAFVGRLTESQQQGTCPPQVLPTLSEDPFRDRSSQSASDTSLPHFALSDIDDAGPVESVESDGTAMANLVCRIPTTTRYDAEEELKIAGKGGVRREKYCLILAVAIIKYVHLPGPKITQH